MGKSRLDDHTLAVYEKAGFKGPEADRAAASVFTYVLGNALGAAATASLTRKAERGGGDAEESFAKTMKEAAETASQFPRLAARIGSTDYAEGAEESFAFGLRAVLDGLEARLRG
ncbi:TetR/AcrR family transcriptional regulator C-terminal domain-containing protein [Streptomyces sp.]|uniref:TetR/AcrR family transcriptional regulator C-terminal domain-containing protein n=1 Tax=Streptomyces sp. TaxID=1931 RepID=UPI002F958FBF